MYNIEHTCKTSANASGHLAYNTRQHRQATSRWRLVSYPLEIYSKVVAGYQAICIEKEHGQTSGIYHPLFYHPKWNHRRVSLFVLPNQEQKQIASRSAEQPDNYCTIPSIRRPTPFESQEEHNHGWGEQHKTDDVEIMK